MKYISIIVSSIFLMALSSCDDFLTENPKSNMSKDQYFQTAEHAKAAVNDLYRSGTPSLNHVPGEFQGSLTMLGGYLSGLYDNEYKGQSAFVHYLQNLTYTSVNISDKMENVWASCYAAISRTNYILKYIGGISDLSDKDKQALTAQTLFFRGLNYFYLVRFFGGVPLTLEPYESLENLYIPRSSAKEVYAQIIADLKEALKGGLNDKPFTKNGFRISQSTAEMLLADVYLSMSGYPLQDNHYKDVAELTRRIIHSGKHSLLQNGNTPEESVYNKLRTIDDSDEYIYSYEYNGDQFNNGARIRISLPSSASSWGVFKIGSTANAYGPTSYLLDCFDKNNDLRVQEKQYIHTKFVYEKGDKTITKEFNPAPYFFFEEEAALVTGIGKKDIPIYRYSETLLMAAEAIAMSEGVTDEAVEYVTEVRERAYTKNSHAEIFNSLKNLSKEDFIHEVWNERLREFLFEFKIWSDIQRTRKYPVGVNGTGKVNYVNVIGAENPWGVKFEEKNLLFPLPYYEMQRNPALKQNEGYNDK